eukprot:TRINITY_DN2636_c0_g1_i3.p1 TRINITY_DN2636_c0_g1~~TRINITY_DN2636_c0_g1_i3.p1  ORF type:complete len:211 (-),score=9.19 TRINITY_DN2636_c0_g1_i3:308-940(-)
MASVTHGVLLFLITLSFHLSSAAVFPTSAGSGLSFSKVSGKRSAHKFSMRAAVAGYRRGESAKDELPRQGQLRLHRHLQQRRNAALVDKGMHPGLGMHFTPNVLGVQPGHHPGQGHHPGKGGHCNNRPGLCLFYNITNPGYDTCCSKKCVDLKSSQKNCGKCFQRCTSNELCCNSVCTNIVNNESNCGSCGNVCPVNTVCISGICGNYGR